MSTNLKRYIVIFPLVFTLLLSCVPILGAHAADYSEYFLSPEDLPQFFDNYDKDYLFQKADEVDANTNGFMTADGYSSQDFDYYFYSVWCTRSAYNNYQNTPQKFECRVVFFNSDQLTPVYSDDDFVTYRCSYADSLYFTTDSQSSIFDASSSKYYGKNRNLYFVYDKHAGQFSIYSREEHSFSLSEVGYIFYEDCNIPDFPIPEGISHGSSLNVTVELDPPLTGRVDSKLMWNGQKLDNPFIRFALCNNGKKNVHYSFFITDPGYDICSFVNAKPYPVLDYSFPDSVKFALTKEEWQEVNYLDNTTTKAKGQTFWQIQKPGNNRGNFICWSQMRLLKDKNYDCVVLAYASDLDYLPRFGTPQWSACQGNIVEVYRSTFTLTDDTKFDPNNDSFGNTSFKPGQHFLDSFSQYYDQDGVLQTGRFTSSDITGNRNSSNHVYNGNTYSGDYSGVVSSGGNFNSLSYSISGFLSFFNGVWSYIPSNYAALIGLSITSLIVISIFKGVFK